MGTDDSDETDADDSELPAVSENVDTIDAAFQIPIELDENDYLIDDMDICPDHGVVMPIALPYAHEKDATQPEGFHLVCPRCRYCFAEYEPDNFDFFTN